MPIYESRCNKCGHELEVQQKLAEAPLKKCPECGKSALEKLISATSFQLKGGGWYSDLYSSPKPGDKPRTDNDRGDRVQKAVADDKKKTATDSKPNKDSKKDSKKAAQG